MDASYPNMYRERCSANLQSSAQYAKPVRYTQSQKEASSYAMIHHFKYAEAALEAVRELRAEASQFCSQVFESDRIDDSVVEKKNMCFDRIMEIYKKLERLAKTVNVLPTAALSSLSILECLFNTAEEADVVDQEEYMSCQAYESNQQICLDKMLDSFTVTEFPKKGIVLGNLSQTSVTDEEKAINQFFDFLTGLESNREKLLSRNIEIICIKRTSHSATIEVGFGCPRDGFYVAQLKTVFEFNCALSSANTVPALMSFLLASTCHADQNVSSIILEQDGEYFSRYEVFRKISHYTSKKVLSRFNLRRMKECSSFMQILWYIQLYTLCFSSRCQGCHKVMRDFLPPVVLKECRPQVTFFHEGCAFA